MQNNAFQKTVTHMNQGWHGMPAATEGGQPMGLVCTNNVTNAYFHVETQAFSQVCF